MLMSVIMNVLKLIWVTVVASDSVLLYIKCQSKTDLNLVNLNVYTAIGAVFKLYFKSDYQVKIKLF